MKLAALWKAVSMFAYRRWVSLEGTGPKAIGLPGVRDPLDPCEHYAPHPVRFGEYFTNCETDGHYLCRECCHRQKDEASR